jgi:UBX domain-containing protein 7
MDDAVETFTAFTGATTEIAKRYLGMTENNTEQAIQLFFDSPDLASGIDRPPQPPQPQAPPIPSSTRPQPRGASAGRQDAQGVVHLDSDDEGPMELDENNEEQSSRAAAAAAAAAADYEDDEVIARRMQEELYAGGDSSGYGTDDVRAPIARTTETLIGGPDGDYTDEMHVQAMQHMRARQQAPSSGMDINSLSGGVLFSLLISL